MERGRYTPESVATILSSGGMMRLRDRRYKAGVSGIEAHPEKFKFRYKEAPFVPDLPPSEIIYFGPMYSQRGEPLCYTWSVANAAVALGFEPPAEVLAEQLNRRLEAIESQDEYMCLSTEYGVLDAMAKAFNGLTWGRLYLDSRLVDRYLARIQGLPQLYQWDARFIKDAIDNKSILVVSLAGNKYYTPREDQPHENHTISIVGYRIMPSMGMRVQVLDSNVGNVWLPLEFISAAAYDFYWVHYDGDQERQDWYVEPDQQTHALLRSPFDDITNRKERIAKPSFRNIHNFHASGNSGLSRIRIWSDSEVAEAPQNDNSITPDKLDNPFLKRPDISSPSNLLKYDIFLNNRDREIPL